jgi:hypothetical protein
MIRTPLRPLARILQARDKGENPDAIERENLRLRHEQMRDKMRTRAEMRLIVMGMVFFCGFILVGSRMALLASTEPEEPTTTIAGSQIVAQRADIVDRRGRILATNIDTHALYAQPQQMIDPVRVAKELKVIFPDVDEDRLVKDFTGKRKFVWVRARPCRRSRCRRFMTSVIPVCCSAPVKPAFIPMAGSPAMFWAGPALAVKAFTPLRLSALRASKRPLTAGCVIRPMAAHPCSFPLI